MANRNIALLACAALVLAGVAGAQSVQGARVTDGQVGSINVSMRAQIRAIADSALAAGLDAEPILDRGRQGSTFRAPPARVVPVASALLRDMRAARTALGAGATSADINAGAAALSAGVNAGTLSRIAKENRNAALFVSLSVLSDLVTANVPVDTAVRMVSRLVVAGIRDADLTSYRDNVRSDIARGGLPSDAATSRADGIVQKVGATDFTAAGPVSRATGRPRIPPEEH